MGSKPLNYDTLNELVGAVTMGWSNLESHLRTFLYDLAAYESAAFEQADAFHVVTVLFSHMEIRQAMASAKALAYGVNDIPEFYERTEKLLNWIDNELRSERNRCVHDAWRIWGNTIYRVKSGTVVRRQTASGERKLIHNTSKEYAGTTELKELADDIRKATSELEDLGDEIRDKLNEKRPL